MLFRNSFLSNVANGLILLVLGSYLLKQASFIVIPLAWSVFLSISLDPLCDWLERKRFPRVLAEFIVIILLSLVAMITIYYFVDQAMGLMERGPLIEGKVKENFSQLNVWTRNRLGLDIGIDNIQFGISEILDGKVLSNLLQSTAETILMLGIIPVYIFFFIYYKDFFFAFINKLAYKKGTSPPKWFQDARGMVQNYLKGMLFVTIIVAIMATLVFYFLGVKYYLFFALFVALFNLIPYIGVILSSVVSVLYVWLTTDSILYPLLTLLLLWLIQIIENNIITPIVVGTKIKLNPLAVILSIMVGGWLWGLSGVILFNPLVGVLKIVFDNIKGLSPYGYLLGTDIPVYERNENFLKVIKKRLGFFK
ncbi:AI-2E family transporter [Echinicola jeungdonensis]|uniref:AI-2E family transporter n=1 Tax=Echinicola jeungdonensis TaxID=709343 RepID=A0ABV5J972_9BACT|nr:AI-2E family transporter [Echinicola jeungdonensis]MDN3670524.1 AI-2E family transporter [Echinicola jeungdonensis]